MSEKYARLCGGTNEEPYVRALGIQHVNLHQANRACLARHKPVQHTRRWTLHYNARLMDFIAVRT